MKKNVLIVNGNIEYAEELKEMIKGINPYINIDIASDMKAVYEYLMNTTVDMFVLDSMINIKNRGDMSGIRLAEQIRENSKYILTPIIFVSTRRDMELYAYEELNCLGFFVKPFSKERFQVKVQRGLCYHTPRNEDKTLFFRKENMICPIRVKDIVYIESVEHIMNIHLSMVMWWKCFIKLIARFCRKRIRNICFNVTGV